MDFLLADAAEDEAPEIARIWSSSWWETHADLVDAPLRALRAPESFEPRVRNVIGTTRVARQGDRILGFCTVRADELYQLFVAPEGRGTGVAQALLADAETRLQRMGNHRIWLACMIGNDRAARFYEKHDWINMGETTDDVETAEGHYRVGIWRFEKTLPV
ncbi:MAG: GNAT family N-acetyltransferase [Silicimonas sp.]|nr:GNAT family N-acetyltransferase [Silicimonas sp.]